MSGTKDGGKAAAVTNKLKYGEDFYGRIGAEGGKKKVPKGFAMNRELAAAAGARDGRISRRTGVPAKGSVSEANRNIFKRMVLKIRRSK